ncbi:MAG: guanylate kinase [Candidatus Omnitrophica bacterium]|nr:guanylate kinase [Candidatus Omnitrophota bacterium]
MMQTLSARLKTKNSSKRSGLLIVLSAPSGTGKTTVMKEFFAKDKNLVDSVSWTTRKPRSGEKHKKDYFFVSRRKFLEAIKRGGFLEWAKVYHEFYGTPKAYVLKKLREGKDVVLVIDTRGAQKVRHFKPSVHIFLKPPSIAVLKKRLHGRNADSAHQLEARLKEVRYEMSQADKYDYRIVNHTVVQTVRDVEKILNRERAKFFKKTKGGS